MPRWWVGWKRFSQAASTLRPHEPEGADKEPQANDGFLVAWDAVANRERWRVSDAGGLGGDGAVTTAGNLVFHGSTAYNADTGEKLWKVNLGGTYCNRSATSSTESSMLRFSRAATPTAGCSCSRSMPRNRSRRCLGNGFIDRVRRPLRWGLPPCHPVRA